MGFMRGLGRGWAVRRLGLALLAVAVLAAACDEEPTGPTGNPLTIAGVTESFTATVPVGGAVFYSFNSPSDGLIKLTLLELTVNGVGSTAFINMGIGTPAGTGCSVTDSRTIQSGVSPQFEDFFTAGVYCVRLFDIGDLTEPALAAVNISHPR
jgi:hypothetical protein